MTGSRIDRLRIVAGGADLPPARPGTFVLVIDPAWTAMPGDRGDVLGARTLFGEIVGRTDLPEEALSLVDRYALETGLADRLTVEGVTYWFRFRETAWRWLHERLAWHHLLGSLDLRRPGIDIRYPEQASAIGDVIRGFGGVATAQPGHGPEELVPATVIDERSATLTATSAAALIGAMSRWNPRRWRLRLGATRRSGSGSGGSTDREALLAERVARIAAGRRPKILVLTTPATHQVLSDGQVRDPILGSTIPSLLEAGLDVVLLGIGLDARRDADWELIRSDDRLLPQSLMRTRWGRPEDRSRSDAAVVAVREGAAKTTGPKLEIEGTDLTPAFLAMLESELGRIVEADVLQLARIERLLPELRPRAVLLAQEGIRLPWLRASRDAGIPAFAVQHGVLYPGHAGYPNRRHPHLVLPSTTFVYGDYERRVLVAELAYEPGEVEVSGSPRLDLDSTQDPHLEDRSAIRAQLGVAPDDRLVVVSTVNLPFVQGVHLAPMIERVLGGPLPNVHLVFKQHPGERGEGPYGELIASLARAGDYSSPPVTVVRMIDLYALLRAADAHLGLHSTVLTDAVAAGCPNLIAVTDAHNDLLGYVDAGVARPVDGVESVQAALDHPIPVDLARRSAFLDDHARPGDAGLRIAAAIGRAIDADVAVRMELA